jgi:fatty acid desaturase
MRNNERPPRRDPGICAEALRHGRFIRQSDEARYPIPRHLNMALAAAEIVTAFALLSAASHAHRLWQISLFAVAFTFLMQLGFGLAHEAAHGKLHPNPRVNEAFGICLYSLFPGSYHLFAIAHLVHHRRNRSDAELEDYILPTETPWLKRVTYYSLLCGLFWLLTPPTVLAIAMWPATSIRMPAPDTNAGVASRYLQFFNSVNPGRVRRDVLITAALWTAAWLLFHFKLSHLAICYAAFAFGWASQQYIYHVRTPRHVVLGAIDLHLWRPFQLLYLNFNFHLTHHVAAGVPWIYLPRIAAEQPSQSFLAAYFDQWRPPQPLQKAWPSHFQTSGPLPPHAALVIAGEPQEQHARIR